jgi:hypothetical protein
MTDNALTIYQQFGQIQQAAGALYKSGYFTDAKSEAQAIVKVMAGAELGLPPFAAMTGIHIIQGKPALGANVIATLIKNDPRYDYRVLEHTDAVCRIQFYENGKPCGVSEFTAQDARKAQTKNMDKFPKNMLFARAISNGAKWYTPGIFGGTPVYTPDELGADVDEDGVIIEGSYTPAVVANEPVAINKPTRKAPPPPPPADFDDVNTSDAQETRAARTADEAKAELVMAALGNGDGEPPLAGEKQLKYARASLSKLVDGNNADAKLLLYHLFGIESSAQLTVPAASAVIDWVGSTAANNWQPDPVSIQEAARLITAANVEAGQMALIED